MPTTNGASTAVNAAATTRERQAAISSRADTESCKRGPRGASANTSGWFWNSTSRSFAAGGAVVAPDNGLPILWASGALYVGPAFGEFQNRRFLQGLQAWEGEKLQAALLFFGRLWREEDPALLAVCQRMATSHPRDKPQTAPTHYAAREGSREGGFLTDGNQHHDQRGGIEEVKTHELSTIRSCWTVLTSLVLNVLTDGHPRGWAESQICWDRSASVGNAWGWTSWCPRDHKPLPVGTPRASLHFSGLHASYTSWTPSGIAPRSSSPVRRIWACMSALLPVTATFVSIAAPFSSQHDSHKFVGLVLKIIWSIDTAQILNDPRLQNFVEPRNVITHDAATHRSARHGTLNLEMSREKSSRDHTCIISVLRVAIPRLCVANDRQKPTQLFEHNPRTCTF